MPRPDRRSQRTDRFLRKTCTRVVLGRSAGRLRSFPIKSAKCSSATRCSRRLRSSSGRAYKREMRRAEKRAHVGGASPRPSRVPRDRQTADWPVCVWPWLRPSLMSLICRKVPANAHLPEDGPECTGPAEWRMAIPVSNMNIAFHDQIGHEMSISSISRLCCTVRERADFR
jgi:hypothetical protein